jgi:hypothetical protein
MKWIDMKAFFSCELRKKLSFSGPFLLYADSQFWKENILLIFSFYRFKINCSVNLNLLKIFLKFSKSFMKNDLFYFDTLFKIEWLKNWQNAFLWSSTCFSNAIFNIFWRPYSFLHSLNALRSFVFLLPFIVLPRDQRGPYFLQLSGDKLMLHFS